MGTLISYCQRCCGSRAEPFASESIIFKPVDSEPMDSEPVESEPVESEPINPIKSNKVKVVLVGDTGVGKYCLITSYLRNEFEDN